eukprot:7753648-Pyramimonas_sp.AAC.1
MEGVGRQGRRRRRRPSSRAASPFRRAPSGSRRRSESSTGQGRETKAGGGEVGHPLSWKKRGIDEAVQEGDCNSAGRLHMALERSGQLWG